MFTDIYVALQGSQVLQERWREEAATDRFARLIELLRRKTASK